MAVRIRLEASGVSPVNLSSRNGGFGIIEIVVSMFLISLLAIAFLPMLVTALRVSASNTTLASATQIVASEMANIRAQGTACTSLQNYAASSLTVFDRESRELRPEFDLVECPTSYPAMLPVRVFVTDNSSGNVLAEATTKIFVNGLS